MAAILGLITIAILIGSPLVYVLIIRKENKKRGEDDKGGS